MKRLFFLSACFLFSLFTGQGQEKRELLRRPVVRDVQPQIRNLNTTAVFTSNSNQPDTIKMVHSGQLHTIVNPQTTFTLPPKINTAVIKGAGIRQYESSGRYQSSKGMQTLKGRILGERYISRIAGVSAPANLNLFVDTMNILYYKREEGAFQGDVNVLLLDDSPGELHSRKLVEPVSIELSANVMTSIDPKSARITHTNLPSTSFRIVDKSLQDVVQVNIKTVFNPTGYLKLMKKQPILRIETPSRSVQGFGVQSIPITIRTVGSDHPVNVNIVTDKGIVMPDNIVIPVDGGSTVALRSEGIGRGTLRISAAGFADESQIFTFVIPWSFVIFSLVGGFLGSLVKYRSKKGRKKLINLIWISLIAGFIGAILYYILGIQIFSFKISELMTEFGVLGLSFLSAIAWDSIYVYLSKSAQKS